MSSADELAFFVFIEPTIARVPGGTPFQFLAAALGVNAENRTKQKNVASLPSSLRYAATGHAAIVITRRPCSRSSGHRRRLSRRLRALGPGLLLTLCRVVQRACAIGAARAGSITQSMPPLAGTVAVALSHPGPRTICPRATVALSHAGPRAICPRAAVEADPAIALETRCLAGSAFFLGLGRAAVTTPLGAGTILTEQLCAGNTQEQTRRDASNDNFDFHN